MPTGVGWGLAAPTPPSPASGYGLTLSNPVKTVSFRERLMAESRLTNLRSHNTSGFNIQIVAISPGWDADRLQR
jgi:hypothetical protein